MAAVAECPFDRIVFDSGFIRVGAFRCHPHDPGFHDSGPSRHFCFVFPRTAVEIQHEHEPAFVANPNVVTFYNRGQAYLRNAISAEGDRCDWFGVDADTVRDAVREIDPTLDSRPEMPFRFSHAWSDADNYLLQRQIFRTLMGNVPSNAMPQEEQILILLHRVVRSTYGAPRQPARGIDGRQREAVRHIELLLSEPRMERLTLRDIGAEVGMSVYQLCRLFRRATGTTLHRYRQKLHVRASLEAVAESTRPLVDIALETGFSSHSHFTSTFHREFARTPSRVRTERAIS